ncbi:PREDICTED: uncharacterized protein LOC102830805 [Chrysochloris asiatica]|uniref:Uncharacterized protein LOC102830805 n=1 Tax=Chrysochloris asiatica TaxID=185453 RepID=A0A9B0U7N7_CHRAS|nr:PREDICTED: uncharacterized protein LOC102830805 [Chrysochloris asiatica]
MANHVFCNRCFQGPHNTSRFSLTNCGHVYCDVCLCKGKKDECLICKAPCRTVSLSKHVSWNLQCFDWSLLTICPKYERRTSQISEFQDKHRRRLYTFYREKISKLEDSLRKAMLEIEQLQSVRSSQQPAFNTMKTSMSTKPNGYLLFPPSSSALDRAETMEVDVTPSPTRRPEVAAGPMRMSLISPPQDGRMELLLPGFLTPCQRFPLPDPARLEDPREQGKTCTHRNTYTHVHTHTHMYIYSHTHTHTQIHTHKYTYTHVHTHTHRYIYIHIHTQTQIHTHKYTYIHVHTHTHTYIYIHTHTQIHTHKYTYTHVHTHRYTCIHIHTHIHAYTHMHTHMYTYTHVHTHTQIHTHKYTYTHVHSHTHKCTHRYTYTHIHMYTHGVLGALGGSFGVLSGPQGVYGGIGDYRVWGGIEGSWGVAGQQLQLEEVPGLVQFSAPGSTQWQNPILAMSGSQAGGEGRWTRACVNQCWAACCFTLDDSPSPTGRRSCQEDTASRPTLCVFSGKPSSLLSPTGHMDSSSWYRGFRYLAGRRDKCADGQVDPSQQVVSGMRCAEGQLGSQTAAMLAGALEWGEGRQCSRATVSYRRGDDVQAHHDLESCPQNHHLHPEDISVFAT